MAVFYLYRLGLRSINGRVSVEGSTIGIPTEKSFPRYKVRTRSSGRVFVLGE